MSRVTALVEDRLPPDTINRLERAAEMRHEDAKRLLSTGRRLSAVYLFGYSIEMCLAAAYFRAAALSPNSAIDRETRELRMKQARRLRTGTGEPLMNSDPHPLVGWARFVRWKRLAATKPTEPELQRLNEAIRQAERAYKHWRPELRYKAVDVTPAQLAEVLKASQWFLEHRGRL